eukprot:362070-Chlamydomonas_euryale.AAC.5
MPGNSTPRHNKAGQTATGQTALSHTMPCQPWPVVPGHTTLSHTMPHHPWPHRDGPEHTKEGPRCPTSLNRPSPDTPHQPKPDHGRLSPAC